MSRIRDFLASKKLPYFLAAIATFLTLPALFHGFEVDDRLQRAGALGQGPLAFLGRGPTDLFTFLDGKPEHTRALMDLGIATWWTSLDGRLAFFRPISSLLLWADHHILKYAILLHIHSLVWYIGTIVVAFALYRRFISEKWIAGLASFMFAVDHTHGLPTAWIAQRNTLITGFFGLLTLYFHDRARREKGHERDALIASLMLGLGLFSAEAAVAILPYLFAHALIFDRSRFVRALAPYAPPFLLWSLVYKLGGHGAHGSGLYVDPGDAPLAYLDNVLRHGPILAATELGLPGGDFYPFVPPPAKIFIIVCSLAVIAVVLWALRPLLRIEINTRFLFLGGMLAILPSCATIPSSRLTFLAGFGLVGALAQFIAAWRDKAEWFPQRGFAKWRSMPVVLWCGLGHVFLSPFAYVISMHQMTVFESVIKRLAQGMPDDPNVASQRLVLYNPPEPVFVGYVLILRSDEGRATPKNLLSLSNGARASTLRRSDETTVILSSNEGIVQPSTDLLARDEKPFVVGYRVEMSDYSVEVTRINAGGWPVEAKFTFAHELENDAYRWMKWNGETLVPMALPKIGETISVPGQTLRPY